jgi:hypothetical protein
VGDRDSREFALNSDTVGVAGQVAQDMLGAAEGRFEVDHPVLPGQGAQEGGEGLRLTEGLERSRESIRISQGTRIFSRVPCSVPFRRWVLFPVEPAVLLTHTSSAHSFHRFGSIGAATFVANEEQS